MISLSSIPQTVPEKEKVYLDSNDGLLHCKKCGTAKQLKINWAGEEHTVYCMCECESAEYNAECEKIKADEKIAKIHQNISIGMCGKHRTETFDVAEDSTAIRVAKKYVANFEDNRKKNIGLMFYGDTGTGKSFAAACIANYLLNKGVSVLMTNLSKVINELYSRTDKNAVLDDICSFDLIIIDDLGVERNTPTARQYVEDVIDAILRAEKPLIVTTNIDPSTPVENIVENRMMSRLAELCTPVKVAGQDRRRQNQQDKLNFFKSTLKGGGENE